MTLGFSQVINKKPNGFVEKILVGLYKNQIIPISKLCELCREPNHPMPVEYYFIDSARAIIDGVKPKLHTIRIDEHDRWKAGNDIHFVINNRTPKRFQFAPVIKCKSVQKIEIKHIPLTRPLGVKKPVVWIDGKLFYDLAEINIDSMKRLANNDGFDSVDDFFAYFNKDFTGKLIHWTDLKY